MTTIKTRDELRTYLQFQLQLLEIECVGQPTWKVADIVGWGDRMQELIPTFTKALGTVMAKGVICKEEMLLYVAIHNYYENCKEMTSRGMIAIDESEKLYVNTVFNEITKAVQDW